MKNFFVVISGSDVKKCFVIFVNGSIYVGSFDVMKFFEEIVISVFKGNMLC